MSVGCTARSCRDAVVFLKRTPGQGRVMVTYAGRGASLTTSL